jgi:hypothetical protein
MIVPWITAAQAGENWSNTAYWSVGSSGSSFP